MFKTPRSTQLLCIAALAIVLAAQAVPVHAQPAATAWPMFGQNAQRTGESLFVGSQKGDLKWVAGNSGTGIAIGPSAIYVDGMAIGFDGSLKWRLNVGGMSPAIDDEGTIYFGTNSGTFYAIAPTQPGAVVDTHHYLIGAVKWTYQTGMIQSSAAIGADGSIVAGSLTGFLYKFNKDGFVWQLPLGAGSESSPAIDTDGTIYIGCEDGNLCAVSPGGTLKWKFAAGNQQINAGPAIADDHRVYFTTKRYTLWAIDPLATAKSRKKWSVSLGKANDWDLCQSRPAVDNVRSTVYCGGLDGLYAYAFSGTLKWKLRTPNQIWAQPAVGADGTVYARCFDGKIYAVAPNGQLRWSFAAGGNNFSDPVIDFDGTVYVGGTGLHAFQDGAVARPTVFWLAANPNPVAASQPLDLWVIGVTGGSHPVQQVDFYWDTNGNGVLDPELAPGDGGDVLLGTNDTGPDGYGNWHITTVPGIPSGPGLPVGTSTIFAQSTEQTTGIKSNVVSNEVTVTGP